MRTCWPRGTPPPGRKGRPATPSSAGPACTSWRRSAEAFSPPRESWSSAPSTSATAVGEPCTNAAASPASRVPGATWTAFRFPEGVDARQRLRRALVPRSKIGIILEGPRTAGALQRHDGVAVTDTTAARLGTASLAAVVEALPPGVAVLAAHGTACY